MLTLLLMLALQAPVDEEITMLRARTRALEVELAVIKDRLAYRTENEATVLTAADVVAMISIAAAALGVGKVSYDKIRG